MSKNQGIGLLKVTGQQQSRSVKTTTSWKLHLVSKMDLLLLREDEYFCIVYAPPRACDNECRILLQINVDEFRDQHLVISSGDFNVGATDWIGSYTKTTRNTGLPKLIVYGHS